MTGEAFDIVRHPSARKLKLSFDPVTGRARLTLPRRAALKHALEWAREKQGWIAEQRARLPQARPFAPGATVPFAGEDIEIAWSPELPRTPKLDGNRLLVGGPREGLERRIARWFQRQALDVLTAETAEYAARAGVSVGRVGIGDPKGRWGSCTASGDIRYSWRLILAPPHVRRATVAHEVAHRVHMHHGPAFHAFVAEIYGSDPAPARGWMKAHGAALHWVGREMANS